MSALPPPLEVFYSYADADEDLSIELDKHLSQLRRDGLIVTFHKHQITAGTDLTKALDQHLNTASIILLLVSSDFVASDYCYGIEMQRAMERHNAGDARVIPILLRLVDWQSALFGRLEVLPGNKRPVASWSDRDEAFTDVARGIRKVIDEVIGKQAGSLRAIEAQVPPPSVKERILQILYEKRSDPTFDGEDLAHLIGKRWYEIQSDVADLKEKGYIVIKQSQITTRIFHRPRITATGIEFFESGMPTTL